MNARAKKAMKAVRAYPASDPKDIEVSIVDLLTDLLHLIEAKDLCITDCLRVAEGHYQAEGGIQRP